MLLEVGCRVILNDFLTMKKRREYYRSVLQMEITRLDDFRKKRFAIVSTAQAQ